MTAKTSSIKSVDQWIDEQDAAALECRDTGHQWPRGILMDITGRNRAGTRITELTRTLTCQGGCGVKRLDIFTPDRRTGRVEKVDSRMDYSGSGYLRPSDGSVEKGPIDRALVRATIVHRMFPDLEF